MKKQYMFAFVLVVSLLMVGAPAASADSFTFATITADLAGPAGSTVGWGYTIINQSATQWLMTTGVVAGLFQHGTPEAFFFDLPILAPGATLSVAFDLASSAGLYGFTWDSSAPVGFTNSGMFLVSAEWWDGDPLNGGKFIDFAPELTAAYSVSVSGDTSPAPVPEPTSLLLLGTGCALLALRKKLGLSKKNDPR